MLKPVTPKGNVGLYKRKQLNWIQLTRQWGEREREVDTIVENFTVRPTLKIILGIIISTEGLKPPISYRLKLSTGPPTSEIPRNAMRGLSNGANARGECFECQLTGGASIGGCFLDIFAGFSQ